MWHIDSQGTAYNEHGMIVAPFMPLGSTRFSVVMWIPQFDIYDDFGKTFSNLFDAYSFIRVFVDLENKKAKSK